MGTQTLGLFDSAASQAAADVAVTAVEDLAAGWLYDALVALRAVAERQATLTSDAVWKELAVIPSEPRAMGAVMRRAKQLRWIECTATFVATDKVTQHGQPIRVWRSLLYQEPMDGGAREQVVTDK